ncbi:MAG: sulfatase-like hydrolase/transferase [Sedimentisphaerales bacterium]|nr:sulfatase-like hydrolase/transferase [Sedimentisphaerales bacterium]
MRLSRRAFLKTVGIGAAAMMAPGCSQEEKVSVNTRDRRPNVILIYTDDQGSIDLNCYGAKDLYTPNLDRLAEQGLRFTQFYVGAPVCSPSRAALMTGRYPQRAQLAGNTSSMKGHAGMPTEQITIAEVLKRADYTTGHVGKWHLGYTPETMPNGQGYGSSFGHMGGCIDNYSHFFYWNGPNRHDLWRNGKEVWHDGEYFGDLMVQECNRFIHENRKEPFFLYWAINMPHYPLQGLDKFRDRYKDMPEPRKFYAAFVSTVDDMIGRVLQTVNELGIREDTIIIYLSDHGHSVEERTYFGGGDSGSYRGHKFTLWEGGIRVPCIVSWPGKIAQGEVRPQVAINMDWMPTIAKWCGTTIEHRIDGLDLSEVIESANTPSPHKQLHWERPGGKQIHWVAREGDWKLVVNGPATKDRHLDLPAEQEFLSNLSKDVTETKNLADQHPEKVERLKQLHDQWRKSVLEQ